MGIMLVAFAFANVKNCLLSDYVAPTRRLQHSSSP